MKICGIISEYNPFHKGHKYHIDKTKELTNCDAIVCVMSGNFVQRGLPSIMDKWTRAELALGNGVDLVLELPSIYAISSAEFFSFGAISLLNSLGVIDNISFGSELGDVNFLNSISEVLIKEPKEYLIHLKNNLDLGYSYAVARNNALEYYFKELLSDPITKKDNISKILNSSNNILAIEYCKSLLNLASSITPVTIKREGGTYNSQNLNNIFSSATAIRNSLKDNTSIEVLKDTVPDNVFYKLKSYDNFVYPDAMVPYLRFKALCSKHSCLSNIPEASEGLDNKIINSLESLINYEDILGDIKSKRYAMTRISRILCQYFIGFEKYNINTLRRTPCPYARVLGFTPKGQEILRTLKSTSSIPVYTKLPKESNEILDLDIQCTKAYSLLNTSISSKDDYLKKPMILKI